MIDFFKYQGTGNDFIIIDNRNNGLSLNTNQIAFLCHRRFGIGADGLILLQPHPYHHFYMKYYNSDGNESSMCGNGGRCIASFAHSLNLGSNNKLVFEAIDGVHEALILDDEVVSLKMNDVSNINQLNNDYELNTGSPHYVLFKNDIDAIDLNNLAKSIRFNEVYKEKGINVNIVETLNLNTIKVRTYERGVEDETLSCGTGVTACAIAYSAKYNMTKNNQQINVKTPGGNLQVSFDVEEHAYKNVWLTGKASFVFKGYIEL